MSIEPTVRGMIDAGDSPASGEARRYPHLDLLRGGAALLVLFEHARAAFLLPWPNVQQANPILKAFYAITGLGHQAVMIFFALSGFLVGGQLIQKLRAKQFSIRLYMLRRFTRLWVVVLPALMLTAGFDAVGSVLGEASAYDGVLGGLVPSLPRDHPAAHGALTFVGNLAFLQTISVAVYGSNGPLWSLANEFWYYVLAPLIGLVVLGREQNALVRLIALGLALAIGLWLPSNMVLLGFVWLMGALAAWFGATSFGRRIVTESIVRLTALAPLIVSLVFVRLGGGASDLVVGVSAALGLPVVARLPSPGRWYSRAALGLSEISYTLYLTHFPLVVAIAAIFVLPDRLAPDLAGLGVWAAVVCCALVWAIAGWLLFERRTELIYHFIAHRMPNMNIARTDAER